jgi:hypothetical protein
MPKTWAEKMMTRTEPQFEVLTKPFGGFPPGSKMLIATPMIVKEYIEAIPSGEQRTVPEMRLELAKQFESDMTCPLTASIFARIVSEAALDELRTGKDESQITPFWRLVDPKSPLAKKLSCGVDYLRAKRAFEIA